MAAEDKKGGTSAGAGSGGGTPSRKSPLSGGSRKPVTIDLSAKDVSKTETAASKVKRAAKQPAGKATASRTSAVPSSGKRQSTSAASAQSTTDAKAAADVKTAAASARPSADTKTAAQTSATGQSTADKTTAASAKGSGNGQADKAGPKGTGAPPPPPPSGKGSGTPPDEPARPPKPGAGFGAMLAAGVIGALIVGGAGLGLHRVGMLQMVSAGSVQNTSEIEALLESSKRQYSQLQQEITALKDRAADSYAAKETIQNLTTQLDVVQKETSAKLKDAISGVTNRVQQEATTLGAEIKQLNDFIASGTAGDGAALASLKRTQDQLAKQVATLSSSSQKNVEQVLSAIQSNLAVLQNQFQAMKEAPVQLKDFGDQLALVSTKVDETAAQIGKLAAEQQTLEGKVDVLVQRDAEANKLLNDRVDGLAKALGSASAQERAARAIAIASLRNAVDSGESYEAELAAVETVLPSDARELASLKAGAANGIPSSAELIAGFAKVARDMSAVSLTSENDDVVDRLFSSAKSLVSIRKPSDSEGTSSNELLGTMESRVAAGDLSGAMKAYDALPEPMKKAGAAWAVQVKARLAADELVKKITAQVLKSLVSENK
ncbi:hypothetical protein PsAD2_01155 [Pseudovibrio axinellae]|uniref:Uncharacterized protein n=1 Tax=Pseudovibrio axinellae TaxID=989403 RepID=A0A166A6D8_9HYPH|nr:phage tail protein [Pseudovibrio axinellae]KZL20669.1 hypothetical protein PsAD2_01155 [Pseudovibrio axinellae]SER26267.1 hypothetical protein SAMN05421798_107222 [Pseudovibrio axinellae]